LTEIGESLIRRELLKDLDLGGSTLVAEWKERPEISGIDSEGEKAFNACMVVR
jgi:hypothetical protein